MPFSPLRKSFALSIDLLILSPILGLIVSGFTADFSDMRTDFLSEHWAGCVLSFLFVVYGYHILFFHLFRMSIGQFCLRQSAEPIINRQIVKSEFPLSVKLAALILAMTFATLTSMDVREKLRLSDDSCSIIGKNAGVWSSGIERHPSRLSVAMALFEVKLVPSECLLREANREIQAKQNLAEANLALIRIDKNYPIDRLREECANQLQSDACRFAFRAGYLNEPRSLASEPEEQTIHREYFKIFEVDRLARNHEYEKAIGLLEKERAPKVLTSFSYEKKMSLQMLTTKQL